MLPGLTFSNELISRDESMHARFSAEMYRTLVNDEKIEKLKEEEIHAIIQDAFECEAAFVEDMLSGNILGFTKEMMLDYTKHVCNVILSMLDCNQQFERVQQPFEFMDMISLMRKTNFFENRVSEYAKPQSERVFSLDEDF